MDSNQHKAIRGPIILEDIHSSGRCTGQIGNKRVYLEEGIPGETVTFSLERRKRGFYGGKTAGIINPSSRRLVPFCKHYHTCGGCNWQHIDYGHQLELKHRILCLALEKYGIITPEVPPVTASPETRLYRHRMEYAFASRTYSGSGEFSGPAPGFHMPGEPGKIASIEECHLQSGPGNALCEFTANFAHEHGMDFYDHKNKTGFLRSLSVRINQKGEVLVVVGFNDQRPEEIDKLLGSIRYAFPEIVSLNHTIYASPVNSQMQGDVVPFGNTLPYLFETLGGYRFRIHATSFFQPNAKQAEQIFLTAGNWANARGHEIVFDLYTGVGTIACFLAGKVKKVTGIEGSEAAISDAITNARMNGLQNTEFLTGDILETFRPPFLEKHGKPDLIVLDPPRSGTLIEIKKTINSSGAAKVIYLSCNPVSLAFDLKQLGEMYRVTRIQPFDMLPHTHHLETLVLLEHR